MAGYGIRRACDATDVATLAFQVVDIHIRDTLPTKVEYSASGMVGQSFMASLPRDQGGEHACTVCVFACEASGASAMVTVRDFRPYLTYEVVSATQRNMLIAELRTRCADLAWERRAGKRLYGFVPSADDPRVPRTFEFVRVSFPTLRAMYNAKREGPIQGAQPCETKTDVNMMFVDSCGVAPSGWFRLQMGAVAGAQRASHCSLEVETSMAHIVPMPERIDMAPLLVASVDIECYSASDSFPDEALPDDRVAIISTTFWRVGEPIDRTTTVLQCVGACDPVEGAHVESHASEVDMLQAWRDLIAVHADPDIVIGYNVFGFDYKYLAARGKLGARYWYQGRLAALASTSATRNLESNALGQNTMITMGWVGRVDIDIFNYVKAQHKLQVYKLDAVAEHFLGERKVDLPYAELNRCLRGGAAEMARAAGYCRGDTELPLRLLRRLEILPAMVEMSRVTLTTLCQLVFRGQQIKVFNQLVWHAHRSGYVLNDAPPPKEGEEKYEGATVIAPTVGFYRTPVATLDFASLYPSIMLAHNLCFSTHVIDPQYRDLPGVEYETHAVSAEGETFVTSTAGVLPQILRDLLAARKRAKKDMARAPTEELKALYNARQLALKVSCNSVYGFTGAAARGMYADVAIARSVTFLGRAMIEKTARAVEAFIPEAFGLSCAVIYGDTDSVMVHLPHAEVTPARAFEIGEAAAVHISGMFREDVVLEMEKVYQPYLLIAKKRYAGMMHAPNKQGVVVVEKLDAKGIELVRRDNCAFAKRVYEQVLTPILQGCDPELAYANLKANLAALTADEVPLAQFVLTKSLKKLESYTNKQQAHIVVAQKLSDRSNGLAAPRAGDRLPFYIAEGASPKVSERAEDPEWGAARGVKPDRLYYLEHQVVNPVTTLFTPFEGGLKEQVEALFLASRVELELQRAKQMRLHSFLSPSGGEAGRSAFDALDELPAVTRAPKKRARGGGRGGRA